MKTKNILPSLFDQLDLDPDRSCDSRDQGIHQAMDHAQEQIQEWKLRAYFQLCQFLATFTGEKFMAEEVRLFASKKGLPVPPTNRAWGGIMAKAKGQGLIVQVGIGRVSNEKAHRANAAIWKKVNQ